MFKVEETAKEMLFCTSSCDSPMPDEANESTIFYTTWLQIKLSYESLNIQTDEKYW